MPYKSVAKANSRKSNIRSIFGKLFLIGDNLKYFPKSKRNEY